MYFKSINKHITPRNQSRYLISIRSLCVADGRKFSYFKLRGMNSFDLIQKKENHKTYFIRKWISITVKTVNIHECYIIYVVENNPI